MKNPYVTPCCTIRDLSSSDLSPFLLFFFFFFFFFFAGHKPTKSTYTYTVTLACWHSQTRRQCYREERGGGVQGWLAGQDEEEQRYKKSMKVRWTHTGKRYRGRVDGKL